ncbi:hypothetical protein [Bacillus taeanensis]|uniref:hypothetical protein n=1 Tax=Bacillus taeanensis TaxID=273032 RepID=UPI0015F07191|nr:hypothetical protein [Bacillus taeanensis]
MLVCNDHVLKGIKLLDVPHIHKAPTGVTCSFCTKNAVLKLYYAHTPFSLGDLKKEA